MIRIMDEMIKEIYEQLGNDTYPGLAMYARDVNLTEKQFSQYKTGLIIMERGFTDATARFMGMKTTHRITILSNHMTDLSEFEHGTNWGLHIANANAHFKILDIYEYKGKTQILMLHLPDDYRWKLFENMTISIDEDLIKDARKRFENKAFAKVPKEIATNDWLDRCKMPLGMFEDGTLFETEITLESQKMPFKEASFRKFYHQFIYLECRALMEQIMPELINVNDTGLIMYGYIDEEAGLSFQPIAIASETKYGLNTRRIDNEAMYVIRSDNFEDSQYCQLDYFDLDRSSFSDFAKNIKEIYETKNKEKAKTRQVAFLDSFRNNHYPDDFPVVLIKEGLNPEQVWVRISMFDDGEMTGTILNQPYADFGVSVGDEITFYFYELEKDHLILVSQR